MLHKFTLMGEPVPQARVRIFKRGNKVMTFDPQTAVKRDMKYELRQQLPEGWEMPKHPRIMFWFYMSIPKSMTKQQRNKAIQGNLKHVKKPDVDNLIKLYLDVVSGIAIEDDNCVSLGQAVKVYSSKPRVEIYIEDAGELITMDEIWEGTWPTMEYS